LSSFLCAYANARRRRSRWQTAVGFELGVQIVDAIAEHSEVRIWWN